jgi:hypothetical protein
MTIPIAKEMVSTMNALADSDEASVPEESNEMPNARLHRLVNKRPQKAWSEEELTRLVEGTEKFGKDIVKITEYVGTRNKSAVD